MCICVDEKMSYSVYLSIYVCKSVYMCACDVYVCPCGADAGVAIDDRAVTTVTLRGIRMCLLNTNQSSPGT